MIRSPSGLSRFPIAAPEERSPQAKPGGGKGAPAAGAPKPPRPPRSKNRP